MTVHSFEVRIVNPSTDEMFPPTAEGTNYVIEQAARQAAADALNPTLPEGWTVEVPE